MTHLILAALVVILAAKIVRREYRIHAAHRVYDRVMTAIATREQQAATDLLVAEALWALPVADRRTP